MWEDLVKENNFSWELDWELEETAEEKEKYSPKKLQISTCSKS